MRSKLIGAVWVIAAICAGIALYGIESSNDQIVETSIIAMFAFVFIGAALALKWRTSRAKVNVPEEDRATDSLLSS